MRYPYAARRRPGTSLVEAAVVYPIVFMLMLGLLVGGMGVFRYQEVSHLAREGARWASVHGAQYHQDQGTYPGSVGGTYERTDSSPAPGIRWYKVDSSPASGTWTGDIYNGAIKPNIMTLDENYVTCEIGWPRVTNLAGTVVQDNPDNWRGSKVFVTVNYKWFPEVYLVGPFTLTSTSAMPMTN